MTKRALLLGLTLGWAMQAGATPFDPVFRVTALRGECTVVRPGEAGFEPAEDGRAYPYGSVFSVRSAGTAKIELSRESDIVVGADTTVEMSLPADNGAARVAGLREGELQVRLAADFSEGNALLVRTALVDAHAVAPKFVASETVSGEQTRTTIASAADGAVKVTGPEFLVERLANATLVVEGQVDKSMLSLRVTKGAVVVSLRNEVGETETAELKPGGVIKIWRQVSEDIQLRSVVVRRIDSEGRTEKLMTYQAPLTPLLPPVLAPSAKAISAMRPCQLSCDGRLGLGFLLGL